MTHTLRPGRTRIVLEPAGLDTLGFSTARHCPWPVITQGYQLNESFFIIYLFFSQGQPINKPLGICLESKKSLCVPFRNNYCRIQYMLQMSPDLHTSANSFRNGLTNVELAKGRLHRR
jgi:hypothetical protein